MKQNQYYIKNRNDILIKAREKYKNNRETILKQRKRYYKQNKDKIISQHKKYIYKKYKHDPLLSITMRCRARIYSMIKTNSEYNQIKTFDLIGCTPQQLKDYLESKFLEGMSWENRDEWHIDHIIPCASFDLTKVEEQQKCFHYTNLQPLWAVDNLKKGVKMVNNIGD